nr:hypothetical protein [Pseudonocardia spinosispora]
MTGDALQHLTQMIMFGRVDPREQGSLALFGYQFGARQQLEGSSSQMNGVGAPVFRMRSPLYEFTSFEVVDQAHHDIAVHPDQLGEPLLRLTFAA